MDLSQLKFAVDTTELDRAGKTIGDLVVNVGKLDKAARDAARTEATLAKAAKDNASANLDNAKAQAVNAKAVENTEKAHKSAAASIEKSNSILQRQNDIYDFQTQGFSKGQAGILASAKATGQLSEELKKVLIDQKAFESNPFDKSELGLQRLQKTMKEVVAAQGFFNEGNNLTTKQARELSNDLDRIGVSLTKQGKSYQEVTKAQALHKQEFIQEAAAVNRAQSALDIVTKQRKEVATAADYVTQADQKMAAALNVSNVSLDKAGTDSLVRYESALRKSGLAQDVVTQKLSTYKTQLTQVQAQEMKRREDHLTRALAPQVTDVGVSLWSGQNPLTVLLQQGGQITDLFMQSGVSAEKFKEVVKASMSSMLPSILIVAKGIGGLFVDGFVSAGKAVQNFIASSLGLTGVLDKLYTTLSADGPSKWGGAIRGLSTLLTGVFSVGVLAVVAGLAALTVGFKQIITENNDLAKAFALSGGSIGLSHAQLVGYVKTLATTGATTGQATEALVAMAKAGTFTSKEILLVSDSAIQMQKGFGIAIEDTIKQFAKLKEKPVEALLEIAKSSGMVGPEVIKMVQELERAGRTTDAASLAMKAYGDVTKQQISQMKEDYNGFSLFIIEWSQKIKEKVSGVIKSIFISTSPDKQLENQLENVRDRIKGITKRGSGARGDDFSLGNEDELPMLKEQERILQSRISATVRLQGEEEKRKVTNTENAKYQEIALKLITESEKATEKELRSKMNLADFTKSYVNEKLVAAAKEKSGDIEKLRLNKELMTILEKEAGIEFKKAQKKGPANLDPGKIAKAQLDSDIADIRHESEAQIKVYSDGEAILEALRSAALIDEKSYNASKAEFLSLRNQTAEDGLNKEIERLKKENLLGKDLIDNDKKIADARAKLAITKASGAAGMTLMGIKSEGDASAQDKFFKDQESASDARAKSMVEGIRVSQLSALDVENEAYAARIAALKQFNATRAEGEAGVNNLIETERQKHEERISAIQMQYESAGLAAMSATADKILEVLTRSGNEQTALGKAVFLAQKAIAVAQIIMQTEVAAAAAIKDGAMFSIFGIPTGIALATVLRATGYASAGMVAGMAIAEASAEGGYDIPEGKNPVVQTHAKEMILPRAQADVIRDMAKNNNNTGNSAITIVNNTSAKIGKVTEQRMSDGERVLIIEEATQAAEARINAAMQDPNSKTSRSMSRNFALQRSR